MYYRLDKNELVYVKVNWISLSFKIFVGIVLLCLLLGFTLKPRDVNSFTENELIFIATKQNEFSKEKFIKEIKNLNFKFPHIVYAQALLETNGFKSRIFLENNNLFGMKEAVVRINKSLGTKNGHSYYENWKESLDDYALYSATYLSRINSEEDYFDYLSQGYAEDPNYINKLKKIIDEQKLNKLFL